MLGTEVNHPKDAWKFSTSPTLIWFEEYRIDLGRPLCKGLPYYQIEQTLPIPEGNLLKVSHLSRVTIPEICIVHYLLNKLQRNYILTWVLTTLSPSTTNGTIFDTTNTWL